MRLLPWVALAVAVIWWSRKSSTEEDASATPSPISLQPEEIEIASYYGPGYAGRQTANGEIFDPSQMTAAHRTLPFNTKVRVTDIDTGRNVVVRINDRGPFAKKNGIYTRSIDLSQGAAENLDMVKKGLARVVITRLT